MPKRKKTRGGIKKYTINRGGKIYNIYVKPDFTNKNLYVCISNSSDKILGKIKLNLNSILNVDQMKKKINKYIDNFL